MRRLLVAATGLTALGCATPYAKLDGVLPKEPGRVTVIHEGQPRDGSLQQSIVKGDGMRTSADGAALLTIRPGYEVIVEPGAEISIENPSIFVRIGRLILKKLKAAKERLELKSEFVSAGVEGTHFVFEVLRDGTVHIMVVDGVVVVRPRQATWAAVTYRAGEEGFIRRGSAPDPVRRLDARSAQAIRDRTLTVEQAVGYRAGQPWSRFKPLWQRPIFFLPAAAVVAGGVVLGVVLTGPSSSSVIVVIPPFF